MPDHGWRNLSSVAARCHAVSGLSKDTGSASQHTRGQSFPASLTGRSGQAQGWMELRRFVVGLLRKVLPHRCILRSERAPLFLLISRLTGHR